MVKRTSSLILDKEVKYVDFKFVDMPGTWQHFTVPRRELTDEVLKKGIGFDGSSIRGFQAIHESDMMLLPDPRTAVIDPYSEPRTLSLTCSVIHPISRKPYSRDPRTIAGRAEEFLRKTGLADASYWGPELEGFIFDSMSFSTGINEAFHRIESRAGIWDSGKGNAAYRPRKKEGYFPVAPTDKFQDFRNRVVEVLESVGIQVERQHSEVATGGQFEIDFRFGPLVETADRVMMYKYVLKNQANKEGMVATFMPKPLFGDNGSGMHVHQSLWKGNRPLFYEKNGTPFHLSKMAKHYIAGLLKHAPALMAFCAPTTNSYKRLVPGYEAPVNLVYSARNRSAAVRIPTYSDKPGAIRPEFRPPDPSCNPYFAFAAMLMAGIDGIQRKMDPGLPLDKDTYHLSPEEKAMVASVPGSLEESLAALDKDNRFLLKDGVFTDDLIRTWISYCKEKADDMRLRPHPREFELWHDV